MKRLKALKNWQFEIGSNRAVIILSDRVIKIPKHFRGIQANKLEYKNYCAAPTNTIAHTKLCHFCLTQERLFDIEIYPRNANIDDIPPYARHLFEIKTNNRLQIGKDKFGTWKIFDYEDIKFIKGGN